MKGIPTLFNDIIRKQLKVYAAWLPITNTLKLGDYGIIVGDLFEPIGNIETDFGVAFTSQVAPDADIDFKSSGVRTTKFVAGAKVSVIPAGAVDAKVSLVFEKESSFLIQSPSIQVTQIPNTNAIAKKLMVHPDWDRKFKVVFKVLHAKEVVVIATIEAGTEIDFTGEVQALNNLQLGNIGLQISSNKSTGLKTHGKEGVIGLGLFRIKNALFSKPEIELLRGKKKGTPVKSTTPEVEINDGVVWKNDL